MDTYLEKVTLSVTASSSKAWATASSTKAYSGYLHSLYYTTDATNPLTANSSSRIRLRAGTTTARIVCQTSSGVTGAARYWYPRHAVHTSTAGGVRLATSSANAWMCDRPCLCREPLTLVRINKSTSAPSSTQGCSVTAFIEGVHP